MTTLSNNRMALVNAGKKSEFAQWCEEKKEEIAITAGVATGVAFIPTPPTMFFGSAWSIVLAGVSIACAYA